MDRLLECPWRLYDVVMQRCFSTVNRNAYHGTRAGPDRGDHSADPRAPRQVGELTQACARPGPRVREHARGARASTRRGGPACPGPEEARASRGGAGGLRSGGIPEAGHPGAAPARSSSHSPASRSELGTLSPREQEIAQLVTEVVSPVAAEPGCLRSSRSTPGSTGVASRWRAGEDWNVQMNTEPQGQCSPR